MFRVVVIACSMQVDSQSMKVAEYVKASLQHIHNLNHVRVIDLATEPIPNWRADLWCDRTLDATWCAVSNEIAESDCIVFIVPEWNGMVPPALLNLLTLANSGEFAHKPALIVGISAGSGGAYPIAQLRSYGCKNTRICYIPDHIIIRGIADLLNDVLPQSQQDQSIRDRITYALGTLMAYCRALSEVRKSGYIDVGAYPYGM